MGKIISVKRFEIHDGDGIRTTLFLKGCPLHCLWCHNPESISVKSELAYLENKCIGCGECAKVCDVHSMSDDGHNFSRKDCRACGECEKVCLGDALIFYGKETSAEDILPKLLEDKALFDESGGGVTISGGEPLMQIDFTLELLKKLRENGVNTAVDTSGFASREAFEKLMPYTDTFLYDVKAFDEEVHKKCTGQSNKIILDNLAYITEKGAKVEIRIPFVPTKNDDQIEKIGKFLVGIKNIKKIKVLPYHSLARSKYTSLGLEYQGEDIPLPTAEDIRLAVDTLRTLGLPAFDPDGE